jgi:hypothetical protein
MSVMQKESYQTRIWRDYETDHSAEGISTRPACGIRSREREREKETAVLNIRTGKRRGWTQVCDRVHAYAAVQFHMAACELEVYSEFLRLFQHRDVCCYGKPSNCFVIMAALTKRWKECNEFSFGILKLVRETKDGCNCMYTRISSI